MNLLIIKKLQTLDPETLSGPIRALLDSNLQEVLDWLRACVGDYQIEVNPTGYVHWNGCTPTTTLPIKGDGWVIAQHRVASWNPLTVKLHITNDADFIAATLAMSEHLRVWVYHRYGME